MSASVPVCSAVRVLQSTVLREFDKASNSYKVTHRLIKTKGSDYRIDGITVSTVG